MLNATFRSACELSLSWTRSSQSKPSHPTCWRFILILSFHLHRGLPSGLFCSGFPTKKKFVYTCHLSHTCYMLRPSHSRFGDSNSIWWRGKIIKPRVVHALQILVFVIFRKFVSVDVFKLQSCRNQEEFQLHVARNIAIVQQCYTTQSVSTW